MRGNPLFAGVLFLSAAMLCGISATAKPMAENNQQQADNTKQNSDHQVTADQQKENSTDRKITQKIRQALHNDDALSMYAHNVKIITREGKVTLRGPVRSMAEKRAVAEKAEEVAGAGNVRNDLEVKPSNQ